MKKLLRIMVVEDSILVRQRIAEVIDAAPQLSMVGWADTEAGALAKIKALHPDVIVLDIRLLEGNGLNVLAALQNKLVTPMPGVVVHTNCSRAEYLPRVAQLGADYFLEKRTQSPNLLRVLNSFIESPATT